MTTTPAELVLIPLRMAAWSRGQQGHPITRGDLIAHSDAGVSQYTALRYTEHLALEGIAASIGTVGDVEFTTMAWVDWFNHRRLHSTLAMLAPAEAEAAHYASTTALHPEPQPV